MKIGYSKTYPVTVYWEKNWLEDEIPTGLTLDSTDEEIEAVMKKVRRIQYALKKQVESFHYEALAASEKQMGTHTVDVPGRNVGFSENDLLSCNDIEVLKSYKFVIKNHPELQPTYDIMLKKLTK